MARALPRRSTLLACCALGLLALAAEIAGIGAIQCLDVGRHVSTPGYAQADFYPPLLAALKVGAALLAARLAWRFARARALERAGLRLIDVIGGGRAAAPARPRPRVRLELSPRLWCAAFVLTSTIYLVQAFKPGKGQRLLSETPIRCKSVDTARRTAERLVPTKAGVVAFSTAGDPELGEYDDEPTIIFRAGRLPQNFEEA